MRWLLIALAATHALAAKRPAQGVIAYRRARRSLDQQRASILAAISSTA